MKTLFFSAFFSIVFVEVLAFSFRLNIWRRRANSVEYAALMFAEANDERAKEKLIISAAINLFGLILFVLTIFGLLFFILSFLIKFASLHESIFLWLTSVIVIAYIWLRSIWLEWQGNKHQTNLNSDLPGARYNRISRWLHWMGLEIGLIRTMSFELEKVFFLKKAMRDPRIVDEPLYVMGLARSGTTVVLEILEKTGAFHSPTYRDMPFVLCPNLWKGLTKYFRLNPNLTTRAHGDGLVIGFDSPESFEEVFWRTACKTESDTTLTYAPATEDTLMDFAAYRQLNLLSASSHNSKSKQALQKIRYLSKNNNNVMRINQLISNPGAHLILIIRDPLATAWSLYKQHQHFTKIQADDIFILAYMRWLGHREFGQGHKPLRVGAQYLKNMNPCEPDYWLAYWLGIYESLWQTVNVMSPEQRSRILLLSYERMCQVPKEEITRLFNFAKIDQLAELFPHIIRPANYEYLSNNFDLNLSSRARNLFYEIIK